MTNKDAGVDILKGQTVSKENRIEWIDTAKGLGLVLVMLAHLKVPYLTTWIYTFHMPLFFFLSGAVFNGKKYTFTSFVKRRLKTLVIPYFSLGSVIWIFFVGVNCIVGEENGIYGSNLEMLWGLLRQEHFWTIWFLACLFIVEILYYLIDKCWPKDSTKIIVSAVVCGGGFLYYRCGGDGLPWNIDVALVAQFFYGLGHIFNHSSRLKSTILNTGNVRGCIVAGSLLLINMLAGVMCIRVSGQSLDMSVGLYGNELLTLVSALAGILCIIWVASHVHLKTLVYLGQNTMIIFAWHSRIIMVFCNYVYAYFGIFQDGGLLTQVLYAMVTFLVMLAVLVPVNERIKHSKVHALFGV